MTKGAWVSESRVGWNKTYLARLDTFLSVIGPNQPAEILPYGRRVPAFSVSGLFAHAARPKSGTWRARPTVSSRSSAVAFSGIS